MALPQAADVTAQKPEASIEDDIAYLAKRHRVSPAIVREIIRRSGATERRKGQGPPLSGLSGRPAPTRHPVIAAGAAPPAASRSDIAMPDATRTLRTRRSRRSHAHRRQRLPSTCPRKNGAVSTGASPRGAAHGILTRAGGPP
jgi:hypothetical protein